MSRMRSALTDAAPSDTKIISRINKETKAVVMATQPRQQISHPEAAHGKKFPIHKRD